MLVHLHGPHIASETASIPKMRSYYARLTAPCSKPTARLNT